MTYEEKCQAFLAQYTHPVEKNASLLCTMKVGGKVDFLVKPKETEEAKEAVALCQKLALPYVVLGNLSNTIVRDEGYRGVCIQLSDSFSGISIDGNKVTVKAGTPLIKLAKTATEAGLSGLEFAGGIPGSVGGGIVMNAGAYGGQISDALWSVTFFDGTAVRELPKDQLDFGYRHSRFMDQKNECILQAVFCLSAGGDMELLREYNQRRREKQPLDLPNCGSVFKRPKGHYAGKLIEDCGLKGKCLGGAQVSMKHSGFIVNQGNATAADVLGLMKQVQDTVWDLTGVRLENEWFILGEKTC